ncbi:hypothetical protein BDF22DRAFT_666368 [Syncephalis plumigaleata]|nr:hypothetical protein BDF22DRAFT_666368 [Syncephalis plumigaleata]
MSKSTVTDSTMTMSTDTTTTASPSRPAIQFTYRSVKELAAYLGPPNGSLVGEKQTGNIRVFIYSSDGRFLAWATPEKVHMVDAISMQPICEIARPKCNFLSTWERFVKNEGDAPVHRNMVASFTQRNQSNSNAQWTEDESFYARLVTNEVQLYHVNNLANNTYNSLRLEGVSKFSVSPGRSSYIAAFIPERKGAPASIRVFSLTDLQRPKAIKTFFKADNVQMYWNNLGTHLIVLTQTDVDKTGKSYYGETGLYYLPEFVVVYGFMPAKSTLFDHRANAIHDFGTQPRNYIRFSPHGRFICLLDSIWHYRGVLVQKEDIAELYQIAWRPAPASLYPVRKTLSPPPKGIDIGASKTTSSKPVGVYRPPGARAMAASGLGKGDGTSTSRTVPGAAPKETEASTSTKNKKKKDGKKKAETTKTVSDTNGGSSSSNKAANGKKPQDTTSAAAAASTSTPVAVQPKRVLSEAEKKVKAIQRKLKQIAELKERKMRGESLELTQLKKIETEASLQDELSGLL